MGFGFGFGGLDFLLETLKARKSVVPQPRDALGQSLAGLGGAVPGHQGPLARPGLFQFGFELAQLLAQLVGRLLALFEGRRQVVGGLLQHGFAFEHSAGQIVLAGLDGPFGFLLPFLGLGILLAVLPFETLLVGHRSTYRSGSFVDRLFHFAHHLADHLFGIFGAVEQFTDIGFENVRHAGKRPFCHCQTPSFKISLWRYCFCFTL